MLLIVKTTSRYLTFTAVVKKVISNYEYVVHSLSELLRNNSTSSFQLLIHSLVISAITFPTHKQVSPHALKKSTTLSLSIRGAALQKPR